MTALDHEMLAAADEMERMIVRLHQCPGYEPEFRSRLARYVMDTDRVMLAGIMAYVALVTRKDAGQDVLGTLTEMMIGLSASQAMAQASRKEGK